MKKNYEKTYTALTTNFARTIKKKGWVYQYDTDSDSLAISTPKLPKDARIKYFNDEISFYQTKNKDIHGLFIEYFKSNFLKHENLKELKKALDTLDETQGLVRLKQTNTKKVSLSLEEALKSTPLKSSKVIAS